MYSSGVDSREKLVEAMAELMWERGYSATSPRAVRELSGVGQGSMYCLLYTSDAADEL